MDKKKKRKDKKIKRLIQEVEHPTNKEFSERS